MTIERLTELVDHHVHDCERVLDTCPQVTDANHWRYVDQLDALRRVRETIRTLSAAPVKNERLTKRFHEYAKGTNVQDVVDDLDIKLTGILCGTFPRVDRLVSRDGDEVGRIANKNSRPCRLEGCTGVRMHVVWPDGNSTYPCSKGCCQTSPHLWRIG